MEKIKVLIAEDDEMLNEVVTETLEDAGFECIPFYDGLTAWEYLQTNEVSIVLTDIKMPHMDGVELLKRIRERDAKLPPVMVVSAHPDIGDNQSFIDLGAIGFLKKPYSFRQLIDIIKDLFN